jgi:hypothetical protein
MYSVHVEWDGWQPSQISFKIAPPSPTNPPNLKVYTWDLPVHWCVLMEYSQEVEIEY